MASPLDSLPSWVNIDVLQNLAASMPSLQRLISGFSYLMGLLFAFKALMTLKHHGETKSSMAAGGSHGIKEPVVYLFVAAILIYLPTGLSMMLQTTFGQSNILAYAPTESSNSVINNLFGGNEVVGQSVVLIIQTIGLIAFIRGWVLLARSAGHGQQPGQAGKGLVHIFGGLLAINIVLTVQIINNTLFGTS